MQDNTFSNSNNELSSLEDLKIAASKIIIGETLSEKKKKWFERFMNRHGWYRSSEWYILRESYFKDYSFLKMTPKIKEE